MFSEDLGSHQARQEALVAKAPPPAVTPYFADGHSILEVIGRSRRVADAVRTVAGIG
jgi:hypothetical protein